MNETIKYNSEVLKMGENKRVFVKHTSLGTIEREMRFTNDGLYIHLYTVFPLKGTETYDGTIERQYEHAQAIEWKDFGFMEV